MTTFKPSTLRTILFLHDASLTLRRQDRAVDRELHKQRRREFQRALSNPAAAALGPQHRPRVVRDRTKYQRKSRSNSYSAE